MTTDGRVLPGVELRLVSDIIIRGGENISAREMEEELMGLAGVAEVAVVAAPSLDQVREHLAADGLAKQKWPESLRVVDDFPRTPSGKVQKFIVRQRVRGDTLELTISRR